MAASHCQAHSRRFLRLASFRQLYEESPLAWRHEFYGRSVIVHAKYAEAHLPTVSLTHQRQQAGFVRFRCRMRRTANLTWPVRMTE